jgi:Tfp pilus assembly protein PilO
MKGSKTNGSAWRRILIVALLPLTILFWMTGWTFYWLGDQRALANVPRKETTASLRKDNWKQKREQKTAQQQILT